MTNLKQILALFLCVFVFLSGGCGAGVTYNAPRQRYIDTQTNVSHLMNSVVDLVQENPTTHRIRSFCSGFFVGPNKIATANHCVATRIEVFPGLSVQSPPVIGTEFKYITYTQWQNAQTTETIPVPYRARVVAFDDENDVALLSLTPDSPNSDHYLTMNTTTLSVGEVVYVVSNPGSFNWLLTEGIISQLIRGRGGKLDIIEATPNIFFGSSGSPLISSRGEALGVVSMIGHMQSWMGIYSPIRNVSKLVNELR